ncbi:MAG TPA: COX15/CtaA family protein [Verrucomicrobiae bacterium]|nr:COX15/CtaA family protein [Verrucomicrobiae bacterium]
MRRTTEHGPLTWFAVFTAVATFCLIGVGGLVTSHEAGMAVPDWPTSYGYNMFLFPVSKWVGGIFYEHTHRLVASGVGLLTTILMVSLWLKEERRWLRWLGVVAFLAVVGQGVLGGLRVTLYKQELGIFHAALAQAFFLCVSSIALFLSRTWQRLVAAGPSIQFHPAFRALVLGATTLIFLQLLLGATMRHQHAGLAVPDFPLAYGKLWPRTDAAFIEEVNRQRTDYRDYQPITATQIYVHMAHRLNAILVLAAVAACALLVGQGETTSRITRFTRTWLFVILAQALLGAYTVWSNKAADVATAHVALGAVSLVCGGLLFISTAPIALHWAGQAPRLSRAGASPAAEKSREEEPSIHLEEVTNARRGAGRDKRGACPTQQRAGSPVAT